jgi:hypothetical protein
MLSLASRVGRKTGAARVRRNVTRRLRFEPLEDRRLLATFTVTNLNDAPVVAPNSAPGTLRQAIYDANQAAGADVIQFAANLSGNISLSVMDDNAFGASALAITSPITIRGNAAGITIGRDVAAAEMRLFRVTAAGDLSLESISLTGGIVRGTNGANAGENGGDARGGAIYNQGSLQIVASTLYANQAVGGNAGGGAEAWAGSGIGGAIYNDPFDDTKSLSITNTTLSGNAVYSGTGAQVPSSFGGAVYTRNGVLAIRNSTITNSTASTGRGIYILAENGTATADIRSTIVGQSDTGTTIREFVTAPGENGQFVVTGGDNLIRSQTVYLFITVSTDDRCLVHSRTTAGQR